MSRPFITLFVLGLTCCGTSGPPPELPNPIELCDNPQTSSDCGNCANQTACNQCFSTVDAPGISTFHALQICVLCTACYKACNVMSSGVCESAPADAGVCDIGGPSDAACKACQTCALNDPCAAQTSTCQHDTACLDIAGEAAQRLCDTLPM